MSPRGGVNRHSKISAKLTLESTVSTHTGQTGQATGQTGCTDLTAETKKATGQTGCTDRSDRSCAEPVRDQSFSPLLL